MTYEFLVEKTTDFLVRLKAEGPADAGLFASFLSHLQKQLPGIIEDGKMDSKTVILLIDIYPQLLGIAARFKGDQALIIERWAEDILETIHDIVE
jgi:hypothetical protein